MGIVAAIIGAIGAIASLIVHLFFGDAYDKKSWFKELSVLEKGWDDAQKKHAQELASGTSDSVAVAYVEWMQWSERLGHHRSIGRQKGYIC